MSQTTSYTYTPAHSLAECDRILTAPGELFETERVVVDGAILRSFKHIPRSLRTFWLNCVKDYGPKSYILFEEQELTYDETFDRASRLASVLREKYHIRKGDRVAIAMRNCPNWIVAFWACHLLGAVSSLVNSWLPPKPFLHCLTHVSAKAVIVDIERYRLLEPHLGNFGTGRHVLIASVGVADQDARVHGVPSLDEDIRHYTGPKEAWKKEPECKQDDNATIFFTSGTTGMPKAVVSTHRSFMHGYMCTLYGRERLLLRRGLAPWGRPNPKGPQGGLLICIPLFHVTGTTSNLMTYTYQGFKIGLMRKWDKEAAAQFMLKHNLTAFGGVPTQMMDLLTSSLRGQKFLSQLAYGGAPPPPTLIADITTAFPQALIGQGYGMTETNAPIVNFAADDYLQRPKSCGVTAPINEAIIVDSDTLKECPRGTIGELWVRGASVMREYWRDPEETKRVLTRDGWLKTGDLAYVDDEGFVYICDRLKDIIIRGGENIQSVMVENAVFGDLRVQEVAVVAVPDKRLGELVSAVVVPKEGASVTEAEIIEVCKKALPQFAVPVMVLVQTEPLPRNAGGKVLKPEVRKAAAAAWAKRTASSRKTKAKL